MKLDPVAAELRHQFNFVRYDATAHWAMSEAVKCLGLVGSLRAGLPVIYVQIINAEVQLQLGPYHTAHLLTNWVNAAVLNRFLHDEDWRSIEHILRSELTTCSACSIGYTLKATVRFTWSLAAGERFRLLSRRCFTHA